MIQNQIHSQNQIHFQNWVLRIRATHDAIEIQRTGAESEPVFLNLPQGEWKAVSLHENGVPVEELSLRRRERDGALELDWEKAASVRLAARK